VAELVDALDLGSSAARRESSSLSDRTKFFKEKFDLFCLTPQGGSGGARHASRRAVALASFARLFLLYAA
jgi:hypothetical protein